MLRLRRRGQRGAAAVEAVVGFGFMTIFFGVSLLFYRLYFQKTIEEAKTRSEALTVASQMCKGGGGTDTMDTGASLGAGAGVAGRLAGGSLNSTMTMQSVTKTGSTTVSQRIYINEQRVMSGQVHGWSQVYCRPEPQSWGDFFMGGLGNLRGAVGL